MDKLLKSDVNFQRVRDGRNALPFYFDLNLSTARSVAAGTHFIANVAGDSFYADADPIDGNCRVHFQDTNLDRAAVPFYVSPGFIANVPFTQMLIENSAQPGKKIRIAYGVDIDFQPGSVAQIAVSNSGGYTAVRPEAPTGTYASLTGIAANTADPVFLAGANANGAILLSADIGIWDNTTNANGAFVSKATAPTTVVDGAVLLASKFTGVGGATMAANGTLTYPQFIPAGQGLYFITNAAVIAANGFSRACRYKML